MASLGHNELMSQNLVIIGSSNGLYVEQQAIPCANIDILSNDPKEQNSMKFRSKYNNLQNVHHFVVASIWALTHWPLGDLNKILDK